LAPFWCIFTIDWAKENILISSWNRYAIQIVSWPEFTVSRRGFPSG
jgi:hypothetical protein